MMQALPLLRYVILIFTIERRMRTTLIPLLEQTDHFGVKPTLSDLYTKWPNRSDRPLADYARLYPEPY